MLDIILILLLIIHLLLMIAILKLVNITNFNIANVAKDYIKGHHGFTSSMENDQSDVIQKSSMEQSNRKDVESSFNEENFASRLSKTVKTAVSFGEDVIE